jgi:two-component system, sporulation sensor kinase E
MKKFVKRALDKIDRLDIGQVKRMFGDISGENELLESVLNSMDAGIIVTDNENRIVFINKASKRLIPFLKKNPADEIIWQAIDDKEIAQFTEKVLTNQEKVVGREFTLGNGYTRTIALDFSPIVKDQRVQGNLIRIEDVTERRVKEARLRRAESLAALTTLTAGVAHEIKNPLGSIGIHIQLIQKEMRGKEQIETKEVEKYLNVIGEEVTRLNRVVLDFLFAVRPMDIKLEIANLNGVTKELLDFLRFELENARVTLEEELSEIPEIQLDEKYLKQALLNVIQNALQAMPDGGRLRVKTYARGERVYIEITDTGIGIPEALVDKVFEPYYTTKEFGSGLGLTIVYKIIKEHLGEIFVNTKEGKGTTFGMSFPIAQKVKRLLDYTKEGIGSGSH